MRFRRTQLIALLGGFTIWCWWRIRLLGDVRFHLGAFYGYFALVFCFYLLLLWLLGRWEKNGDGAIFQPRKNSTVPLFAIGLVLVVAVMARLLLLDTTPTLSDDIYRYRWDGRVQQAGIDPYAHAPDHPALASLRDADWGRINFPHLRTVYPPLTQLAFRLGVRLHDTLLGQKLVFVAAELLTLVALTLILLHRGRSPLWLAAYAWHPLAILEIAGSGHNDALGIAALWLGLAAWEAGRRMGAAAAWAAAFNARFLSIVLAPWWWYRRQARGRLAAWLVLAVIPFLLQPTAVTALFDSLTAMTDRGSSNASLYLLVSAVAGSGRIAVMLALALGAGWMLWWAKREADPIRYLLGVIAVAAFLAPALHPWYLLWLLPCFCFWRAPALMALTGTVVLAYAVWPGHLADGRWALPVWAHVLEYAPVAILGLWSARTCVWRSSFLSATKPRLLAKS